MSTERIRFANQLRGLAAVSVMVSHLVGVYWIVPDAVSMVTFSPAQAGPPPAVEAFFHWPWFSFGPFGVALFFLISGMVIPFSFAAHGRASFAAARLLRIYPTYLAALALELLVTYASAQAWGRPFAVSFGAMVTNAALVYDLVLHPSLDLVNWTLSVELKFYALAVLLMPALRAGRTGPVLLAGAGLTAVNLVMAAGWVGDLAAVPSSPSYTVSSYSAYLGYMLIGVLFNYRIRGLLGVPAFLGSVAILVGFFLVSWRVGVLAGQFTFVSNNYLYALVLFSILYAGRRFVPANPVLDGLAAISFPLYLVHSLVGYAMLRALMVGAGLGYWPALGVTVVGVGLVATGLHWTVERPTARMGRYLGRSGNASVKTARIVVAR